MHYEPLVLTVFDFAMIIGMIAGLFFVPALLLDRQFVGAGRSALVILGVIATNAVAHVAASLIHF